MDDSSPLVSCILPTYNRPQFLKQAVKYFENQDYCKKELIVVDDGTDDVGDLVSNKMDITYIKMDQRSTIGRKLNIGIEACRGQVIQKIDDDDYYHPAFLRTAVSALAGNDPENSIVACECFLVLILATGRLKFSGHGWFAGGTLCFYKDLWKKNPFCEDIKRSVDSQFIRDNNPNEINIFNPELYILVRHNMGHTWSGGGNQDVTEFFRHQRDYPKSIEDLLSKEDRDFYNSLR
jgi:glycosyltransferase involved in cell wall biosynthesis